jgi:hypothetical protein
VIIQSPCFFELADINDGLVGAKCWLTRDKLGLKNWANVLRTRFFGCLIWNVNFIQHLVQHWSISTNLNKINYKIINIYTTKNILNSEFFPIFTKFRSQLQDANKPLTLSESVSGIKVLRTRLWLSRWNKLFQLYDFLGQGWDIKSR